VIRNQPHIPLPPLPQLIEAIEAVAALGRPLGGPAARVRAIALNTGHLEAGPAMAAVAQTAIETGMPCSDPVREGGDSLWESLLAG
jgi:uncharacterized NAD-dependent epimerase/dehydratase family protein